MEEHASEDKKHDPKYRRYVAALEKCLQSFESVNEWADVISFLSRIGKVFNSFPSFKDIPFKLNLAKRLAQCLNPALPAGVHQKTLEVYEMVFRKIGNEGLVKDLSLYSFGLFPFFEHSATLVKNSLLELYEVYLVPLGSGLTPSLRPLVLSIILGLEEESSEYFTKVNNLLNRIKTAVGTYEFYDAIWTGLLISPHHRLAIINFLLKNIPPNVSNQELIEICVNDTKLVSAALSAALQDEGQLVVRGSLEILLKHFPVEKRFFELQQLVALFQASMYVLTRKDMSLTRRFYTWILNSGSSEIETLSDYNLNVLIMAMKNIINDKFRTPEEFARPFKLLVFILDKPIVADPLLKECLFSLANITIEASKYFSVDEFAKALNSANMLFRMIELDTIWSAFMRHIDSTNLDNCEFVQNDIEVIEFSVDNLCVIDDSSAMIQTHALINFILRKTKDLPSWKVMDLFFGLCIKLMKRLNIVVSKPSKELSLDNSDESTLAVCKNLLEGTSKAFTQDVEMFLLSNSKIITSIASRFDESTDDQRLRIEVFAKLSTLLLLLMSKSSVFMDKKIDFGFDIWLDKILYNLGDSKDINLIETYLDQIQNFSQYWTESYSEVSCTLIEKTLSWLWITFCETSSQKYHLCKIMTDVCHILPNETDIFFAKILSRAIRSTNCSIIENFSLFWDMAVSSQLLGTVPLRVSVLILVDSMTKDEFKYRKCSYFWIFSITKYLNRFLVPSLSSFIDILECGLNEASNSVSSSKKTFRKNFDKDPLIYYLNLIERLLSLNYDDVHNYLTTTEIDPYLAVQMSAFTGLITDHLDIVFEFDYKNNYANLMIILCLPLIVMEEHKYSISSPSLRLAALNMLSSLIKNLNPDSLSFIRILYDLTIHKLNYFVRNVFDTEKQSHFLKLLNCLFSSPLIAQSLTSHDIIYLTEINKKAIESANDSEILNCWCEFALSLSLLPNSNIEIIMSVLNDALILRLQMSFGDISYISPGLLSSIFLCISKLTVFYLAAKSNLFSNNTQLKNSVSCLLNEVKTEPNSALATMKFSSIINLEEFEKILGGFYSAYIWLIDRSENDLNNETNDWNQCNLVLRDSCKLLYSTNSYLITEALLSIFMKHYSPSSDLNLYKFSMLFYDKNASEFIRTTLSMFKTSKESWKNHDILLKFLMQFAKHEIDEIIISETWVVLMGQIKDFSSSGFKYKSIYWLLIETSCHLMDKIERFDALRINKDFDMISRLVESSVVYASKLNEPSQWTCKFDAVVEISSENFTHALMENVKDKNVGKCMNSICLTLIPNISKFFRETDKQNVITMPIINNLITPNFKNPSKNSLIGQISAYCFDNILKLNMISNKLWKRDLWESFFENAFLWMPPYYFSVLSEAFRVILQEPDRFGEVLSKFSTSATASMFLSKDAEILNKALNIRRLSFLIFWGNYDSFRMYLPSLQEKLVDLTKYYNGFILGEIFFLIRVLLLRVNDESISALWPLIMTELVQLFENYSKSDQPSYPDLFAIFQACKLIDMMLTLRTSSILLYHWLFFDSNGQDGLFLTLEQKIKSISKLDVRTSWNPPVDVVKRRPLLSTSSVKDPTELLHFLERARTHLSHDYIMIQNLDTDFIDNMTKNDLLEILEIK